MKVLDVFSCIGFHALGLARAGDFETVAFCESNEHRRQQLARQYPGITIYDDIRTMPPVEADVIFGGPPCQETSVGAAIHGRRSGHSLWPYMLCAGLNAGVEWFVVEQPTGNAEWEAQVSDHLSRAGYHVARLEFGAEDVGAPYLRRRMYFIACTSLPRLEVAWSARSRAIEESKRAALARGDWHPDSIPAFHLDTWRAQDVLDRQESIEALGDSNPPAMAEVIGRMLAFVHEEFQPEEK